MIPIRINPKWTVWYETTYFVNGKKGLYATKTFSAFHNKLHAFTQKAQTLKKDKTVEWPFGLYAEIIKETNWSKNKVE